MLYPSAHYDIILKMRMKLILLTGIILLILLITISFFLIKVNRNKPIVVPFPTPVSQQQNSNLPNGSLQFTTQDKKQAAIGSIVGNLISNLPYKGKDFSLYYNFSKDEFLLYINPNAKQEGNSEFSDYLKKMGVVDSSWLDNLFTTYITPTPTMGVPSPHSTPAL